MGYPLLMHVGGFVPVMVYISLVRSARAVLKDKGIGILIFSYFTTISSLSSVGFIPTNENMPLFKKNSGLLLLIIPQVLLGNAVFPSCLRLLLWVLKSMTRRAENSQEIGYYHLLPHLPSLLLLASVLPYMWLFSSSFFLRSGVALSGFEWDEFFIRRLLVQWFCL